jgi:hypothetical protein
MAAGNEVGSLCVKHAILSLAAAYFLDYVPSEKLRGKANDHYREAVELLNDAIRDPQTEEIGKGDSVVAALILLMSDDVSPFSYFLMISTMLQPLLDAP